MTTQQSFSVRHSVFRVLRMQGPNGLRRLSQHPAGCNSRPACCQSSVHVSHNAVNNGLGAATGPTQATLSLSFEVGAIGAVSPVGTLVGIG
jgi:hypothetical protein